MNVTIEIPDRIAAALSSKGADVPRRVLEMLAVDGYRNGELSRGQVSEMLALSFYETEAFLHQHKVERVADEREQIASILKERAKGPFVAFDPSDETFFNEIREESERMLQAEKD
ncbi:MAG: UPF0175 family protein [Verrucomicrobiae bacterium]|nr:UPF0175 family protein [Verrucomicrobiae bacterium]